MRIKTHSKLELTDVENFVLRQTIAAVYGKGENKNLTVITTVSLICYEVVDHNSVVLSTRDVAKAVECYNNL